MLSEFKSVRTASEFMKSLGALPSKKRLLRRNRGRLLAALRTRVLNARGTRVLRPGDDRGDGDGGRGIVVITRALVI